MLKELISGLTAAASACTIVLAPASGIAEKSTAVISASAATADSYHDDWLHVNENAEIVDMHVWFTDASGSKVVTDGTEGFEVSQAAE